MCRSYLCSYNALGCSDWQVCENLASPAIQEKATRFQVAIFHSISRDFLEFKKAASLANHQSHLQQGHRELLSFG